MSERKVLNKYYPPDFDPSKIPRCKLPKNRQYTVRLMAPFNMRCKTCGEYIYKGKKFNARKEDVENETYLGIRIYRFYIKCTRCLQEISFRTDPENADYEIEEGATRNFQALKLAEEQARREEEALKEEEANNPMKLLENRTEQSRNEIERLEALEELRDLNQKHEDIDYEALVQQHGTETVEQLEERIARQDEEFIKSIKFNKPAISGSKRVVAEEIIEDVKEEPAELPLKKPKLDQISFKPAAKPTNKLGLGITKKPALVLVKKKETVTSSAQKEATSKSNGESLGNDGQQQSEKQPVKSGLSLLSAYSDSESGSGED